MCDIYQKDSWCCRDVINLMQINIATTGTVTIILKCLGWKAVHDETPLTSL